MGSVRFLTRRTCSLCAEALPLVSSRVAALGWVLEMIDVDDAGLDFEFGDRVPVVLLDDAEVLSGRFGRSDIHGALR